jgi:hypothetical protein
MSKPAKMAEVYTRNTSQSGSTMLDKIAAITPIGGSPSLDEIFKDKGIHNRFNVSASELFRQDKLKHGGK